MNKYLDISSGFKDNILYQRATAEIKTHGLSLFVESAMTQLQPTYGMWFCILLTKWNHMHHVVTLKRWRLQPPVWAEVWSKRKQKKTCYLHISFCSPQTRHPLEQSPDQRSPFERRSDAGFAFWSKLLGESAAPQFNAAALIGILRVLAGEGKGTPH